MKKDTILCRCPWCPTDDQLYIEYHDKEWGKPVYDDAKLYEMLILEGAQAGLSWRTVLSKREHYRKAFDNFEMKKIAQYDERKTAELLQNSGIIRNRLKIASAITNAQAFMKIQDEFGSFSKYLWGFVNFTPIVNKPKKLGDYQAKTPLSDMISKDLLKRGFKFVGSTIIYAYLQAIGVVNDHSEDCYLSRLEL